MSQDASATDTIPSRGEEMPARITYAPEWKTVYHGLDVMERGLRISALTFWSLLLVLFFVLGYGSLLWIIGMALIGVMVLSLLISLVGKSLCCAAPRHLRNRALGSIACQLLAIAVALAIGFFALTLGHSPVVYDIPPLFSLLGLAMAILAYWSHALFALFLRGLAYHFREAAVARDMTGYLIAFSVIAGIVVCLVLGMLDAPDDPRYGRASLAYLTLGGIVIPAGIPLVICFLTLLSTTRDFVKAKISHPPEQRPESGHRTLTINA